MINETPKELAEKLIDAFMWCDVSSGLTAPLARDIVKDIVRKHIELLMPYIEAIDCEFHTYDKNQEEYKAALVELEKL